MSGVDTALWDDGEESPLAGREIALVDLLDRVLAQGVVLSGDLTLRIADVDLVHVSLRALVTSVKANMPLPWEEAHP
ncbi:gas vesicle protein [Allostreptomyces psammosilenae]|uniref:Gas vesicle protein n=1 Tax=Allostreptomyces psammosilenae TaxID=1892865 RepID=A0A853A5Z7_9ACTN|nr:gas vesicle protein [Allostreptomyces psammosilenae]NYI06111.1 hypothetical protein [Allostreptomyces psammosilenae]